MVLTIFKMVNMKEKFALLSKKGLKNMLIYI